MGSTVKTVKTVREREREIGRQKERYISKHDET